MLTLMTDSRFFLSPTTSRSRWDANGRNCVPNKNRADFH
jgi:hypothetical protein